MSLKEVHVFNYELLTKVTEENWKEIVKHWVKEDNSISVPINFDDQSDIITIGEGSWHKAAESTAGKVQQRLEVVVLQDAGYMALVMFKGGKDKSLNGVKYLEYDVENNILSYMTDMEMREAPEILSYLITEYGLKCDDGIYAEYLDQPHLFSSSDKAVVNRLQYSDKTGEVPMVYVPLNDKGMPVLDTNNLAHVLSGVAHVIVPATKRVADKLKENAFPHDQIVLMNTADDCVCMSTKAPSVYQISAQVFKAHDGKDGNDVIKFGDAIDSMRQVLEKVSKLNIEQTMKKQEEEIETQKAKIEELEGEIGRLRSKLNYYQQHTSIGKTDESMFKMTEAVIYEGEIQDMLLDLCQKAYDGRKDDPDMRDRRRTYLLKDILDNNQPSGNDAEIINALKEVFGTKGSYVTDTMSRAISRYGFEVNKMNGGHYSITLNGDDRLKGVIASTESDHRAAKNFISDYTNKLFR